MSQMPALFIGHGSPMNTLEKNGFTEAWSAFGRLLPRPKALLVVSAHGYFGATAVTALRRPRTIHDFYAFPQALFDFDYPAPGDPVLVQEIADGVRPEWLGLDRDQRGLDHGTWSVLAHLYPEADIPVVQLSIWNSAACSVVRSPITAESLGRKKVMRLRPKPRPPASSA